MQDIHSAGFLSLPKLAQPDNEAAVSDAPSKQRASTKRDRFEDGKRKLPLHGSQSISEGAQAFKRPRAKSEESQNTGKRNSKIQSKEKSLAKAICASEPEIVQILLKQNASDISMNDPQIYVRLLRLACGIGDIACLKSILPYLTKEQMEFPGKHGRTPLMNAVLNRDIDVAQCLLNFGASPHIKDDFGEDALDSANWLANTSAVFENLKIACEAKR